MTPRKAKSITLDFSEADKPRARAAKKRPGFTPPAPANEDGSLSPEERALAVDQPDAAEALEREVRYQLTKDAAQHEVARRKGLVGPWQAEDLSELVAGIADGSIKPIVPEMLMVAPSGRYLLYKGRINGVHGHSNAGKSWTALLACKQAMEAGEHVFYIDYEDEPRGLVERLMVAFGVKPKVVLEQFTYLRPTTKFDQESVGALLKLRKPSLVVVDAVGGSLAMEGLSYLDDQHIIQWVGNFPGFIAGHGTAVLLLDHNPKDTLNGTLWPIGSQRKKAAITGAQYLQEKVVGFSKEKSGYSKLVTAKDRNGASSEGAVVAHLKVDIVHVRVKGQPQPRTRVSLVDPPSQELADAIKFKSTAKALCRALEEAGALAGADDKALTQTPLQKGVKGDKGYKVGVINQLVQAGFIHADRRGKTADNAPTYHTLIKPWDDNWSPEELELVEPS